MATRSKIVEASFRLGAGRYIQQNGAVMLLGEEILRLKCKKPFVMGGKTAFSLTRKNIRESLSNSGISAVFHCYEGFCNKEKCMSTDTEACDVVVAVGGGNVCDAAKLIAANADLPVITIPTSSATCAAYTPLSVCYNDIGQCTGTVHHKNEVSCVLADMDILCRQPLRLFLAGVYDSHAKMYEVTQRLLGKDKEEIDIGLSSSYELSRVVCEKLNENTEKCCDDIRSGICSKTVYDTVYLTIALTGVISGLARGSNQTAIAHKIYESARTLFPAEVYDRLHGEMVAVGLISQIAFNGDGDAKRFTETMKKLGMPTTLHELGIPTDSSTLQAFYTEINASSAMAGVTEAERENLKTALQLIL